jgi:hypothetical protein
MYSSTAKAMSWLCVGRTPLNRFFSAATASRHFTRSSATRALIVFIFFFDSSRVLAMPPMVNVDGTGKKDVAAKVDIIYDYDNVDSGTQLEKRVVVCNRQEAA